LRSKWFNTIPLLTLLLGTLLPMTAQAAPPYEPPAATPSAPSAQEDPPAEIERALLDKLTVEGAADFIVVMAEQADLSAAYDITDWSARGWYVYNTLREVASRTQAPIVSYAKQNGLKVKTLFTTNSVHVQSGTLSSAQEIAMLPGVALIREPRIAYVDPATIEGPQQPLAPTAYGWNLDTLDPDAGLYGLQAAQVWDQYGIQGSGIVVANIDTGVTYQHEALDRQYRGNLIGSYDHDFDWYAPTSDAQAQCGGDAATSPCDSDGHGSGTAGIMVGETADLTEQLGVAPAAEWIACMGCDLYGPGGAGGCSEEALTACADWMVAPCPIGADPGDPACNPDMRPNIVNNSWGGGGGDDWYRGYIQAWTAAGIFPAFSGGNTAACAAVGSPGDNPEAFGTAAHDNTGQNLYAGGPSVFFPNPGCDPDAHEVDPHVNAPTYGRTAGAAVGTYYNIGGTSGASPHTAGTVALMWSANPGLIGNIGDTFTILEQTADRTSTQIWREGSCGKPACAGSDPYPNYEYGWGYLDALAAVDEALAMANTGTLKGTVTDTSTGAPVAGAQVMATLNVTRSWQTTTDPLGQYSMVVFSGTYAADAYRYGYLPESVADVSVTTGQTTTLDIELTPAAFYTVDGTVTDAATGWPLYAKIDIAGYPDSPIWADPVTGYYSVELAEGITYTFDVAAWVAGYNSATAQVGPLTGEGTHNFPLQADVEACVAPGYEAVVDPTPLVTTDFDTGIPGDWSVVNNGGACVWTDTNPGGRANLTGGSGTFAIADSDDCGPGTTSNTEMRTSAFDASAYDALWIEYKNDYYDLGSTAQVDVYDGTDWVNVEDMSGASQRGPQTRLITTGAGAPTAQVRWHYAGEWDWWWEVDDVRVYGVNCVAPTDGGLVVGNVYDANLSQPLTGADVANDIGDTTTTASTPDPAVDDAFYTLFSPSGAHVFTATNDGFLNNVAAVSVVTGGTVKQDFFLDAGYLVATPDGVEVTVEAGANSKRWLSLENQGALDAQYALIEVPGGYIPNGPLAAMALPAPDSERRFELALGDAPAQGVSAAPWAPNGTVELIVDDGSAEDAIGLTGGGQFIWLNRFTPDPAEYPFTLDQVWMLFRDSMVLGEAIELVIWEDIDGDGDPGTGASFRSAENITVQANDNTTWSVYNLSSPVFFTGPGDVLIGAVNRDATGSHPAAIDTTASQGRSWVGIYSGDPPEPPTLPPDADWSTIDSKGFAGNWTIRGSGVTGFGGGDAIPWLTEVPVSGTVATGVSENIMLTFDAGVLEANQPGTYYGALQVKTDTPYPDATVPVTMNVTAPATWGKIAGTVSSLGYCDLESNPLEDAEVTITSNSGAVWTLLTDAAGDYAQWLDAMYGPLTITASFNEHATAVVTDVVVTGGVTTTVDLDLRWLKPCVTPQPTPLEWTVELGYSDTVPFTVTNMGAAGTSFDLAERNRGFEIAVPTLSKPGASIAFRTDIPMTLVAPDQRSHAIVSSPADPAGTGGDITSYWATSVPVIDGAINPGEWDDALTMDIHDSGVASQPVYMYVKNDGQYLYIAFEDLNDTTIASGNFDQNGIYFDDEGGTPPILYDNIWTNSTCNTYPNGEGNFWFGDFGSDTSVWREWVAGPTACSNIFSPANVNSVPGTTGGHRSYEMRIDLANAALQADPSAGHIFGYYVYVEDYDTGVNNGVWPSAPVFNDPGTYGNLHLASSAAANDMPWLFEHPVSGTVDADSTFPVDVTFDASDAITEVTQPGKYFGMLLVNSDDPVNDEIAVPVTMTVTAPATWGKLMGTVTSLGYCDADPQPLEGVDVLVEASGGVTWTLTTDANGVYAVWLDQSHSPVTVTVSAPDHQNGEASGLAVIGGVTTTQDFDLSWLVPCVDVTPSGVHATLELGATATEAMTLTNTGAADADWNIEEENLGAPTVTPPGTTLLLSEDFEGAFPSTGWALAQTGAADDPGWVQTTLRVHSGTFAAYHNDDDTSGDSISWLIAPQVTIPVGGGELTFWQNENWFSYYAYHGIWISTATDDPADFVELIELGPGTEDDWEEVVVSLNAYAGQDIYIAFRYEGDYADEWYIDDVALRGFDPVVWLAETPTSGNLAADTGEQVVDVDFDASVVDQPGEYYANLKVNSDDPTSPITVPVTMTVTAPAGWAVLDGTVYSLGYCDGEMNPVEGAEVVIENGVAVTLTTGADGMYSYWLAPGIYTVTVSAADHVSAEIVVVMVAAMPQIQDFNLRWLAPCVTATPDAISDTLALGDTSDHPLTIINNGAGSANLSFTEWYEGYMVASVMAPAAPAAPLRLVTIRDNSLTTNPNATFDVGVPAPAKARPEGVYALTHSLSQDVLSGNSAACSAGGLHADNSYIRVFDLAAFGITEYFDVQQVEVGIEEAVAGSGGVQPGVVNLYTLSGPLAWANMTLIGSADVDVADQSLTIIAVPVTATAPAGSVLVVEFFTPNGQADGHSLYVGSNDLGQTAPTYLAAADCSIPEPTDTAAIGFPSMHLVMNVIGYTPEPVNLPWLSEDPLTGVVLGDDTTAVTVTLDAGQAPLPGVYYATLGVDSDDPLNPRYPVAVAMTVTLPANYGKIEGTVYGTGYCDGEMNPLAGTNVVIEDTSGVTITVTTDVSGTYAVWRDEAGSPYTITTTYAEHWDSVAAGVVVTGTETTVQDLELRWMYPCADVASDPITVEVTLGMSDTVLLDIGNNGGWAMNWSFSEEDLGMIETEPGVMAAGGPDAFGYMFADSMEADGPEYEWIEISGTGTAAGMSGMDDDHVFPIALPFPFNFYGTDYTQLAFGSNGTVYFEDNYLGLSNVAIPGSNSYGVNTFIAHYWDDLVIDSTGEVYYQDFGDFFVIEYYNGRKFGSSDPGSWEIILFPNGSILMQYADAALDYGASATIGIQDDVSTGLQYSYNTASLFDGLAICFAYPGTPVDCASGIPWLFEDPSSGTTAMDSTGPVTLTFDASVPEVTKPGEYYGVLTVEVDDEMVDEIPISVTMIVSAPATWGKLGGTVSSLGYCDINPMPLEGAEITVTSAMTEFVQLDVIPTTVLTEDFEVAFPPVGWYVTDTLGTGGQWDRNDAFGVANRTNGTGYSAAAEAYGSGIDWDTELWSPPLDFTGDYVSAVIAFESNFQDYAGNGDAWVDVSIDGGMTWTNEWYWSTDHGPTYETIDLSAYLGETVIVRWRYVATSSTSWYWHIDDVEVTVGVPIWGMQNISWNLTTDENGAYSFWNDEMYSPFTVTVSYPDHVAQTFSDVVVVSDTLTTLDVDLTWLHVCVSTDSAVEVVLPMGTTDVYTLNLADNGAISTPYTLLEEDLGYAIASPQAVADLFGYNVADSNDILGPAYDFVDIAAIGTPLALGDDNSAGPVPIGFNFNFYGNDYTEVYVNSNGYLSFVDGPSDPSNDVLPNVLTPNNIIALMWDDLVGGMAYAYTFDMCPYASGQCMVVQYEGFTHIGGADAGTWQVILFRTGNILVQFEDAGDNAGASSTTGIENQYGTDGINYAANTSVLEDSLTVCFAYPGNSEDCVPFDVVWLDEDAPTGDILANDVTPVVLSFDATLPETSQPGSYLAALRLLTDDPINGAQIIPVTMTVEVPPTWGKIEGSVIGWNHCDMTAFEVEGATVFIESTNGVDTWAVTTDISGTYGLWLDEAHSPVTVTVTHDDYVTLVDSVPFAAGETPTEVPHELRMNAPCFGMDQYAIEFSVTKGHTHTEDLVLINNGAGMLDIADIQHDAWMTPDMMTGTVASDSTHPLNVLFSAVGMSIGQHVGQLVIMNNDPLQPMMTVPVTMTVLTPTLSVDVSATPPDVTHPGDLITYTIVLTNTSDGSIDVKLTDAIPMSTTYVAGSATGGLAYIQPATGDDYVMWSATLPQASPQTFTFAVRVNEDVAAGTVIDNTAEAEIEERLATDTVSVLVTEPGAERFRIYLPLVMCNGQ
jgi:uncharacterized repeat protein (TIGR01451 family)